MTDDVHLLSNQTNFAVVKLKGREYPGVAIQVDTFHEIAANVNRMKSLLQKGDLSELSDEIDALYEELKEILSLIEVVCNSQSVPLPAQFKKQGAE